MSRGRHPGQGPREPAVPVPEIRLYYKLVGFGTGIKNTGSGTGIGTRNSKIWDPGPGLRLEISLKLKKIIFFSFLKSKEVGGLKSMKIEKALRHSRTVIVNQFQ